MDFVVQVLKRYFYMDTEQAVELMLKIHFEGQACVGVFSFDIAETKITPGYVVCTQAQLSITM